MADKKKSGPQEEDRYANDPSVQRPEERIAASREVTAATNEAYRSAGINLGGITASGAGTIAPDLSGATSGVASGTTTTSSGGSGSAGGAT